MEFGICIPHYGKVIDVRKIIENVQYAEQMGFDSVWVTDHIIVPKTMDLIYRDYMLEPVSGVRPGRQGVREGSRDAVDDC
jgi:alkanesulfonate monooxygenase SsuD/methylene tetrahydromethanopterin reductase-like flavin-dependent oxidoreductase (luciferase family)